MSETLRTVRTHVGVLLLVGIGIGLSVLFAVPLSILGRCGSPSPRRRPPLFCTPGAA